EAPQALNAESRRDVLLLVGDKGKIELQRLGERLVLRDSFEAHAEDLRARGAHVCLPVPEGASFLGSTGREVLRIEVDDVRPSAELRGRELPAVVKRAFEIGDRIADFQHALPLAAFELRLKRAAHASCAHFAATSFGAPSASSRMICGFSG